MRLILALSILASSLLAQNYVARQDGFSKDKLLGNNPLSVLTAPSGSGSLLDASRFKMLQSYSMSYSTFGNGNSDMTGLYLNRMQYEFKIPLMLQVDVGFFHKPLALTGREIPGAKDAVLTIPRASLVYQPSKNFTMALEFQQHPAGYGYGTTDYDPFGFSSRFSGNEPFHPGFRR